MIVSANASLDDESSDTGHLAVQPTGFLCMHSLSQSFIKQEHTEIIQQRKWRHMTSNSDSSRDIFKTNILEKSYSKEM